MPADNKNKVEKVAKEINSMTPEMQTRVISAAAVYSGPIPDASQFKKYEEVLPGSADRILKMAENQAAHRQKLEMKAIEADIKNSQRGQTFAFILASIVIIGGLILLMLGKSLEGFVALIGALATLVGVFIYDKTSERKERIEKSKIR